MEKENTFNLQKAERSTNGICEWILEKINTNKQANKQTIFTDTVYFDIWFCVNVYSFIHFLSSYLSIYHNKRIRSKVKIKIRIIYVC